MNNLLNIKHPTYLDSEIDWQIMRDVYSGQRVVKSRKNKYLPATTGHYLDGFGSGNPKSQGYIDYQSYLTRARFYNFTREAVQAAIGMMHSQPPEIEMPKAMEGILTSRGENMAQFLRRINIEQMITGRVGLLLDLPFGLSESNVLPYITTYNAESIINWDTRSRNDKAQNNADMLVFDESGQVRNSEFKWDKIDAYRVLLLAYDEEEDKSVYQQAYFSGRRAGGLNFSYDDLYPIKYQGRALESIPFVFINSCDTDDCPDEPPLLDLANLCLSIYRMDADFRQSLFMQGQDTLVVIGNNADEEKAIQVGAGARIGLPIGGDAKFIGVESGGLAAQAEALEKDKSRASSSGAQTMDTVSRERESGASLGIRMGARTASLNQIALAGAAGLEGILRVAAEWMNLDPELVKVKPNLDFGEVGLSSQSMVEMMAAVNTGFPLSLQSIHKELFEKGLTVKTYDEEIAQLKKEAKEGLIKVSEEKTPSTAE